MRVCAPVLLLNRINENSTEKFCLFRFAVSAIAVSADNARYMQPQIAEAINEPEINFCSLI